MENDQKAFLPCWLKGIPVKKEGEMRVLKLMDKRTYETLSFKRLGRHIA